VVLTVEEVAGMRAEGRLFIREAIDGAIALTSTGN